MIKGTIHRNHQTPNNKETKLHKAKIRRNKRENKKTYHSETLIFSKNILSSAEKIIGAS